VVPGDFRVTRTIDQSHVPALYVFLRLRTWSPHRTAAKRPAFHHRPLCVKSRTSATAKWIKLHGDRLKRKTVRGHCGVSASLKPSNNIHVTYLLTYSACLTYWRVSTSHVAAPVSALKMNRCWRSFIDKPTMQLTYHEWIWRVALGMMWWVEKPAWERATRRTISNTIFVGHRLLNVDDGALCPPDMTSNKKTRKA